MTELATVLARRIASKVDSVALLARSEVRLVFRGPPLEILEQAFDILSQTSTANEVPVLLVEPTLGVGSNPGIGQSGRCDEDHLLNLRNSPTKSTFVALVPPGQHSNLSVGSTTDEFGLRRVGTAANVTVEDWYNDDFIQDLVLEAIEGTGIEAGQREEAAALVRDAIFAADAIDSDRVGHIGAWRLISRVFEARSNPSNLSPGMRISLAAGMPSTEDGQISRRKQVAVLEGIADTVAEGFVTGLARLKDEATDVDVEALEAFQAHLRLRCDLPTAFERAPAAYYSPETSLKLAEPPHWWVSLTVEKWEDLLQEEPASRGEVTITCKNGLFPRGKGIPFVVRDMVELELTAEAAQGGSALVTIERTPAAPAGKLLAQVDASSTIKFVDEVPSRHQAPMRYVASADRLKAGAVKVISLASWGPGIFVTSRLASKLTPPKKRPKGRSGPALESTMLLPGSGRYDLLILTSPGVELQPTATSKSSDTTNLDDSAKRLPILEVEPGQYQLEVEVDGPHQIDLAFTQAGLDGARIDQECRVSIAVEEVEVDGCRSEFERLIRLNRRVVRPAEARAVVVPNRNARSSTLQDWMLSEESAVSSFMPIVIADDYVDAWAKQRWDGPTGPLYSRATFLHDPRPSPSEFAPPAGFAQVRMEMARRLRDHDDHERAGMVETAPLGKWAAKDPGFRSSLETYLELYRRWLQSQPDVACWADVVAVVSVQKDGRTLSRIPDAILISPLHPVRLAWQAVAQEILLEADEVGMPCPAASVMDPDCIPDILSLSLRTPSGIEQVDFLAVENSTDYWSVLWNGQRLGELPTRSGMAPFDDAFGISVGGISTGFSAAQVAKALDDVSGMFAAKPLLAVSVTSAGGMTDACNAGLIEWGKRRFGDDDDMDRAMGRRQLDVYDSREPEFRPDEATIANLAEDTRNSVRWFDQQPQGTLPDLGIVAQLDMAEPEAREVGRRTPLGEGAILRHRVRRQLPGTFVNESRQGIPPAPSPDRLAELLGSGVAAMENLRDAKVGLSFAPNVNVIRDMLHVRRTSFVAVSSSAIDPACFVGGWLEGAYLWDYDLPSYSQRAGDTNGYYLLSQVRDADRESLAKALSTLPGAGGLGEEQVQGVLLEVARRGIPTIRGLTGDSFGATGDLGLFLASRLLQDEFQGAGGRHSLLRVVDGDAGDYHIAMVVPVDPFQGYLSDLARSLRIKGLDSTLSRPDLIVVAAHIKSDSVALQLTPVEVKCRPGSRFPDSDMKDALEQARNMSRLLEGMLPREGTPRAWSLAFRHLVLSIVGFGMRVYSQHLDPSARERWSDFHERIAGAILGPSCPVTIDQRGRLVVIDERPRSTSYDVNGDGFHETIVLGTEDAGLMVAGDPSPFYDSVRAKVGQWSLMPSAEQGEAPSPVAAEPTAASTRPAADMDATPGATDTNSAQGETPTVASTHQPNGGVVLRVGKSVDGFSPRQLALNIADTRLSQLNMGVVGDLGTGKTQFLKSLITQVSRSTAQNRGIRPSFLIFDYKRDYSSADFVEATGARVIRPENLPLNIFDTSMMEQTANKWLHRHLFFADVLDKIYSGIGPVQKDRLKNAVRNAYNSTLGGTPTIYDVHSRYVELTEGRADSVSSIIGDLVDMEIFARSANDTKPFNELLDGVVVVSLDSLGQDDRSKNMLVAIMLNLFYENMLRTPKRPFLGNDPQLRAIDSFLLVDEADNIMQYEFDVLRKLLLQGREFGTGIVLASQYLRHFKVNGTDYREPLLSWFIHKVPNVTPAELSALGLTGSLAELAERVKTLPNHHCLYKSFDVPGEIMRGLPFFELMA